MDQSLPQSRADTRYNCIANADAGAFAAFKFG